MGCLLYDVRLLPGPVPQARSSEVRRPRHSRRSAQVGISINPDREGNRWLKGVNGENKDFYQLVPKKAMKGALSSDAAEAPSEPPAPPVVENGALWLRSVTTFSKTTNDPYRYDQTIQHQPETGGRPSEQQIQTITAARELLGFDPYEEHCANAYTLHALNVQCRFHPEVTDPQQLVNNTYKTLIQTASYLIRSKRKGVN